MQLVLYTHHHSCYKAHPKTKKTNWTEATEWALAAQLSATRQINICCAIYYIAFKPIENFQTNLKILCLSLSFFAPCIHQAKCYRPVQIKFPLKCE